MGSSARAGVVAKMVAAVARVMRVMKIFFIMRTLRLRN
jgi:hypothetical protein